MSLSFLPPPSPPLFAGKPSIRCAKNDYKINITGNPKPITRVSKIKQGKQVKKLKRQLLKNLLKNLLYLS
jgi:hypothetical protein